MKRLRKVLLWLVIVVVSLLVLLVVFISPIAKWAIEKYSVEYTGRQIKMDKLTINLLSGNVTSKGLKIYEANSNSIFFQCNELYGALTVHKLLAKKYEFTDLKLDHPVLYLIEKGKRFNFSDIVDRFSKKNQPADTTKSKPVEWSIKMVDIDSATIVYTNTSPHNVIEVDRCNINIPGISWDNKVYTINTDFSIASGGDVKGKLSFNKNTWVYNVVADINKFDIKPCYVYLKDYLRVNSLNGLLSTHLNITGNMHKASAIAASGNITADGFSIIDNVNDKLTAIEKMSIQIDSLNTEKNIYRFASISLIRPYLKLEMYKDGYNFDRLSTSPVAADTAATTYANIFLMMADYVQNIVSNYVVSNYNADKFSVEGGQFEFIDYTLYDKFRYDFDSLHLYSDRLSSNSSKIYFDVSSILNHSGKMKGNMDINPKDFKDFDIDCTVKNLSVSDFNPYSKYYVATPFLNGIADYTNKTTVVKRELTNDNIIVVNKIIAGKKDKTIKPQYNMPIRLAVALLRDVHGNINLHIPVSGSLDDPKFKWGKVVWQILGNLMIKAASAPFRLLANVFGGSENDYKEVDFNYLQTSINENQQDQLDKLAKVLKQKTDVKLELIQVCNKDDEAEALAISEAKKKYLGIADSATDLQLQQINSLNTDDSAFNKYIDRQLGSNTAFASTQEKCIRLMGKGNLDARVATIMQKRNEAVKNYLLQQQIPASRLSIHNTTKPNDPNLGNTPKFIVNVAEDDSDGSK